MDTNKQGLTKEEKVYNFRYDPSSSNMGINS